jgi:hypothetical protein
MKPPVLCSCGCGTELFPDDRGRPRKWVRGHAHRNKKHSAEWSAKQSRGLRSAWSNPDNFTTLRTQSPELVEKRIAKLRGRVRPPEECAAISKALTGRKLSEETKAKIPKLKGPQFLTAEQERKRRASISVQRKGTHGYGRAARDNPAHFNALHWIVRDSRGVIHEFDNLQSWCRTNEWRFEPDDRPSSKLPLWRRAIGGFNNMQRTDRKASHQWKGWTLVSVLERKQHGAPDLLAREVRNNPA